MPCLLAISRVIVEYAYDLRHNFLPFIVSLFE